MGNRVGGILIETGKMLLIHRIKNNQEYYVIPGGQIKRNETIEDGVKREILEEIGIEIKLLKEKPLLELNQEQSKQYFMLIEKTKGIIGTGTGPEFTSSSYTNHGIYKVEMIPLIQILEDKINLVPLCIKKELITTLTSLNQNINTINSKDLLNIKEKVLYE